MVRHRAVIARLCTYTTMMKNIFDTIRAERQDFLNNEIEVVPGYNFSQYNTIKKIHLYYNSQYSGSNYEEVNGVMKKKFFHNLSTWRCELATKMIDLDIKDFTLVSTNIDTDFNTFLLERELKVWLKTNKLGKILNDISEELPVYGSCVLEKIGEGAELVDLRYFYVDQSAPNLREAAYKNKKMFMTHAQLRKMGTRGWEYTDQAIDNFTGKYQRGYDNNGQQTTNNGSSLYFEGAGTNAPKVDGSPLVEVWMRVGQVPLSWFTDRDSDENEYTFARYYVAGIDCYTVNDNKVIIAEDGLVLYKEQLEEDEDPFREVHYRRTKGRWLGIGIVEGLFENQRRINEVKNQEANAMEAGSIQVFQTRDETVQSNLTTDVQNMEILVTKSSIDPISTESRELGGFQNAAVELEKQSDNITFSRDVVSGENAPSGATLGAIQIQTQQTTAVFDYKKENIGLFYTEFIKDLVFPQMEKKLNMEHILRLTGSLEELTRLRTYIATNYANRRIIQEVLSGKEFDPTQEIYDMYKSLAMADLSKMGDKIWVQINKNYFKDIEYNVDFEVTGEGRDIYAQIKNSEMLLQALQSDPGLLSDPVKKKILYRAMSAMGWSMAELESMESTTMQRGQMQPTPYGQPTQSGVPSPASQPVSAQ